MKMARNEEETFNLVLRKPDMRLFMDNKNEELEEKISTINQQVGLLSRYLSHLSKKVDDTLTLIKVQEEKIKDLESRIEALTAKELEFKTS